jgi:hypothetical protein
LDVNTVCLLLQLTAPGEPLWSAAAWVGITRNGAGQWGDASGTLSSLPWCPNEPNNNAKNGAEGCTNLLTGCASSGPGEALLNDFACDKLARVACSFESDECGGWQGCRCCCCCCCCEGGVGPCHLDARYLSLQGMSWLPGRPSEVGWCADSWMDQPIRQN